ncbi:MAG: TlpA family protein disulfide reductase [Chitinophagaceae bacterium]|nr:MAG: TlpA family protein disulfide reductase [Chitinophagaceae bacterium]
MKIINGFILRRKCIFLSAFIIMLCCNKLIAQNKPNETDSNIKIEVHLVGIENIDTVTLFFWPHVLSEIVDINRYMPHLEKVALLNKQGVVGFELSDIHSPGYLSVSLRKDSWFKLPLYVMDKYLAFPGDSITIKISKNSRYTDTTDSNILKYNIGFAGRGATKYQCRFAADRKAFPDRGAIALLNNKRGFNPDNQWDRSLSRSLEVINSYKKYLAPFAYEVLKADFIGKFQCKKYSEFHLDWIINEKDSLLLKRLTKIYRKGLMNTYTGGVQNKAAVFSNYYASYLFDKARSALAVEGIPRDSGYYYLKKEYGGELRDKLLTIFLLRWYKYFNSLQPELDNALSLVKTPYCLNQLEELNNALARGKPAYNFTLPNISGKMVSLDQFKGKVVFIDFWFTGCTSCVGYYYYTVSKVEKQLEDNSDVVFISISVDGLKKTWINSVHAGKITSPTAPNVINLYAGSEGEVIKQYKITGYPMPLLIDKDGKIFRKSSQELGSKDTLTQSIKEALKKE